MTAKADLWIKNLPAKLIKQSVGGRTAVFFLFALAAVLPIEAAQSQSDAERARPDLRRDVHPAGLPEVYIRDIRTAARLEGEIWSLDVVLDIAAEQKQKVGGANNGKNATERDVRVEFSSPGGEFPKLAVRGKISAENGRIGASLEMPEAQTWSPQRPKLYDLDVRLDAEDGTPADTVHTYFALRVLERKKAAGDAGTIFYLNGRPIYLCGALERSFGSQAGKTAVEDESIRREMEGAKSLGLNALATSQPPEPQRRYWADRMGLLLLEELPPPGDAAPQAKEAWEAVVRAASRGDCEMVLHFRDFITRLRRCAAIGGYAFAELAYAEGSRNGLLRSDGEPKQFGYEAFVRGMRAADLQGGDFVGIDIPDIMEASPREKYAVPVFVSHFSQLRERPKLRWWISGVDNLGQTIETEPEERPAVWRQCEVVFQEPLRVSVPTFRPFVGALAVELLDPQGERLAANYINLAVRPVSTRALADGRLEQMPRSPRVEILGPRRVALRFAPVDYAALDPPDPAADRGEGCGKFTAGGVCRIEYRIAVPEFVRGAAPSAMILMAELSTARDDAGGVRPGESQKHPGRIAVQLFDSPLWNLDVPDAPSDARGVLSCRGQADRGCYGYLVRRKLDLTSRDRLRESIRDEPVMRLSFAAMPREGDGKQAAAGIALFGENTGRYPIDPTIIIETARDMNPPLGPTANDPVAVERVLDNEEQNNKPGG